MNKVKVFDNFLLNIGEYTAHALKQGFRSYHFDHCSFHGISIVDIDSQVPAMLKEMYPGAEPTLSFFRKSPEGQVEPHYIHTDVDMGDWSAILYLNIDPPESDGTVFWKHRDTGAIESSIPHERSSEGLTQAGWQPWRRVEAKWNRLLVFPSRYFHSRSIQENWGIGDMARLTQVTFGKGDIFK